MRLSPAPTPPPSLSPLPRDPGSPIPQLGPWHLGSSCSIVPQGYVTLEQPQERQETPPSQEFPTSWTDLPCSPTFLANLGRGGGGQKAGPRGPHHLHRESLGPLDAALRVCEASQLCSDPFKDRGAT